MGWIRGLGGVHQFHQVLGLSDRFDVSVCQAVHQIICVFGTLALCCQRLPTWRSQQRSKDYHRLSTLAPCLAAFPRCTVTCASATQGYSCALFGGPHARLKDRKLTTVSDILIALGASAAGVEPAAVAAIQQRQAYK